MPEPTTALQPDLLVLPRQHVGGANVTVAPLLVVEILSPSTRAADLGAKRVKYEELGVAVYWIVDPDELQDT
ncbi:MAG: Uma2 family endonuclease [Actinomycetota bacterium]|nr:Uma2 family endonuclease [Actinomycetota bacterium]